MLLYSHDAACHLIELSDMRADRLPAVIHKNYGPLREVIEWAHIYLCKSHSNLGRKGPVCPFVQISMEKGLFFLAVIDDPCITHDEVCVRVLKYRNWFLELKPLEGNDAQFKTIVLLVPYISREQIPEIIDVTQQKLKPEFVANGLMIGEFHFGPPAKRGLWNPNFFP